MIVPLVESGVTVSEPVINAAGLVVTVGGLLLTLAWVYALYRD